MDQASVCSDKRHNVHNTDIFRGVPIITFPISLSFIFVPPIDPH